jgi:two-component system nitrate/nitrite sensor histidine kinase NarX
LDAAEPIKQDLSDPGTPGAEELQTLLIIQRALTSTRDPEDVIRLITQEARRLTGAEFSWVDFVEDDALRLVLYSGEDRTFEEAFESDFRLPIHGSAIGQAILENRIIRLNNMERVDGANEEAVRRLEEADWPGRSIVAVPLILDEEALGVLAIGSPRSHAFDDRDEQTLAMFASSAVIALDNAQRYETERRRREIAEGLREILSVLNVERPLRETLDFIVEQASQFTGATAGIYRIDVKANYASLVASAEMPEELEIDIDDLNTITFRSALRGDPLFVTDIRDTWYQKALKDYQPSPNLQKWREGCRRHFQAGISVPLVVHGEIYGVLAFYYPSPRQSFTREETDLVLTIAKQTALAIENAKFQQDQMERRRIAEALRESISILNSNRPKEEILNSIVAQAVDLLSTQVGAIYLIDDEAMLATGASRGLPEDYQKLRIPVGNMVTGRAVQRREPAALADISSAGETLRGFLQEPGTPTGWQEGVKWVAENFRAVLSVPIQTADRVFGALTLYYDRPRYHTDEEISLAVTFADQAALVLEGDYFQARLRKAAAVEERNRLARDLHDAVTQTLFSASMIAGVLPELWEEDIEAGRYRLRQLESLTRGALAEMRALLLELRPEGLIEGRIQELLRHLVDAAAGRCKAEFSLNIHGSCDMPAEVKIACYRIVQEALHNVVKHAEASHVLVALRCDEDGVRLQVMDDGKGFNADGITSDHMGLRNMRERAEAIGAAFVLNTGKGEGTQLIVTWEPDGKGVLSH